MWGLVYNSPLNSPVVTVDATAGHLQHEGTIFKGDTICIMVIVDLYIFIAI